MPGVGFVESVAMTSLDRKVREPGDQGAESAKVAGNQKGGKAIPPHIVADDVRQARSSMGGGPARRYMGGGSVRVA